MKKFTPKLRTCVLILLSMNSAFSQTKESEKRLTDTGGEYSFAVPAGYVAQQNDEGFGLVNSAQTVMVAIKRHDFQTFEKFKAQSNLENDGFSPMEKVQDVGEQGKTFRVSKQTPQGLLIVDTFVMFSPFGGGMLIVAFSDNANNKVGFQTALQIANSVAFTKPAEYLMKSGVIAQRDYDLANTAYKTAEARYNQAAAQLNQAVLSEQSSAGSGIAQSQAQVQQSQAQVQQSQAQVQQAQAQVQQAEAALRLAEVNLAHTTISSPIDGVVVSRDVNVGQTVAASLSAPTLFTIAKDLTQMQVIANIDQADIGLVEQAKSVKFSVDAFPGKDFDGAIQRCGSTRRTCKTWSLTTS